MKHPNDKRPNSGSRGKAETAIKDRRKKGGNDAAAGEAAIKAIIETGVVAAAADGEAENEELEAILDYCGEVLEIPQESMESVADYARAVLEAVNEHGSDAVLEGIAGRLNDKGRRIAFLLAIGVTASDGEAEDEEHETLAGIAEAFEIPEEEVQQIYEEVGLA